MTANHWAKKPKGYVINAMLAFLLLSAIWSFDIKGVYNVVVAVGVSIATDILCSRFSKRKPVFPDGAVVTGLIIALILSTATSWYMVAATSIMAILSKHLLVYKKKPVFNPAALGLLLSILFFQTGQSWWGAFGDLPGWTVVFLLIGGYMITNRVNKFPQVFSFLGMYFSLLCIMGLVHYGNAGDALRSPFINASLFFAFFMLTDPPTSPAKYKDQVIFGILSAVVGSIVYGVFGGLTYLFIGLLIGNLYHLLKTIASSRARKVVSSL
ncbi:RnfABCDGE type electron transport complex subunit D [Paenibacillus sp. N3.4]|uniref:RnfABCDGE type electron transport complex subunit D n=1 Tax=Paenibacillus sp. N3.4 TaxID=2603222 RepID=UPI0011C74BFB|nr:RnfABCDGE type electron transport complex subunit D [Paenibacillus sp. N3.4]TXK73856.1 RnfABCDGE type electron transport complex subunit D [Paenibacillus sp. N3.4]